MNRKRRAGGKGRVKGSVLLGVLTLATGNATALEDMQLRLSDPVRLNLQSAIRLALEDSRQAQSLRIDREEQLYRVEDIDDRYIPSWSTSIGVSESKTGELGLSSNASSSMQLHTGGALTLSWSKPLRGDNRSTTLRLSQPLLRGFGLRLERDRVSRVHLQEEINRRAFRDAAAGMIHSVIGAWRNVQSARASLKIARESRERARDQLKNSKTLVSIGELAPQELIHAEAAVVNRQYQVTDSERDHRNAMNNLRDVLDMDPDVTLELVEEPLDLEETIPNMEASVETAFDRRTDWLQAETTIVFTDMELYAARNNKLPDLALTGAMNHSSATDEVDWFVGVTYSKLFSGFLKDKDSTRALVRARHAVRQAQLRLRETKQNILRQVDEAVYTVRVALRQIEQSRNAVELAQRRLELQQRKMSVGLSSATELEQVENDLIEAQERRIEARVAYLDALTSLDAATGTTLDRWGITITSVGR